ncbi:site-specific integrase [Miltoncostaea marina]|uniref:tyrosine-type recombinase/integrase n=1 Tax=Miltoncostaea marina TaxID=2843215 RepID=UPI001C3E3323
MSPSVFIVTRRKGGDGAWVSAKRGASAEVRYVVRYRLGGRGSRVRHGGSFRTRRQAEERARFIAGELAARRIPDLGELVPPPAPPPLGEVARAYLASRIDASENTAKVYAQAVDRFGSLAERAPQEITPAHVQAWIGEQSDIQPATLGKYLSVLRLVLDWGDVVPNPARSPKVRLPRQAEGEIEPPSFEEVRAIEGAIAPACRLAVQTLDGAGLRVGELLSLTYGDLDPPRGRMRVARGRTKGGTAGRRWVPLPDCLGATLTGPRDAAAPLFPDLTAQTIRQAMRRACAAAGLRHLTPHDLRHRFISRLVMAGLPITVIQRVVGHGRASVTLDVYSHVLLDEPAGSLEALRRGVLVVFQEEPPQEKGPLSGPFSSVEDTGIEPVTSTLPA